MPECTNPSDEWVVVDSGSHRLRLGFSGHPRPTAVVPPLLPHLSEVADGGQNVDISSRTIIARGAVVDQQALETIWKANLDQLHGCEAENKCYLATVQPLDSRKTQERALEFFFESQKASRVALLPRAPLALFASGRSRGLVIDMGHGITSAVPVFEGYELQHATFRMLVAGADVTAALCKELERACKQEHGAISQSLVEQVKERLAFTRPFRVSPPSGGAGDNTDHLNEASSIVDPAVCFEDRAFELPDGTVVELDASTRSCAPEVYFAGIEGGEGLVPSHVDSHIAARIQHPPEASLTSLLASSFEAMGPQLRPLLCCHTILTRGASLLRGLDTRLKSELKMSKFSHDLVTAGFVLNLDSQRIHAAWTGGSILSSLSTFPQLAISKEQYAEGRGDKQALLDNQVCAPNP